MNGDGGTKEKRVCVSQRASTEGRRFRGRTPRAVVSEQRKVLLPLGCTINMELKAARADGMAEGRPEFSPTAI